jgi:hypothetical protein
LLNFDRKEPPTVPRHAATVVVVRAGADHDGGRPPGPAGREDGLEVFCVLRHPKSSFLGGAVVFPGGKVDPGDSAAAWAELATEPHPRGAEMVEPDSVTPRAIAVAACRETLEEGCILPLEAGLLGLADGPEGLSRWGLRSRSAPQPPVSCGDLDALRREAASTEGGLAAALARRGLRLAVDRLVPWARWVTPEAEERRFDARFFLLELPPGQVGRHDDRETTMSFWARPAVILDRAARGEIFLAPPTTRSLELLATVSTVSHAFGLAAQQSLRPICPLFVPADGPATMGAPPPNRQATMGAPPPNPQATMGAPFLALPGDPMHPVRELRVAGPTRFVLRDGRFVGEHAQFTIEARGGQTT